MRLFQSSFAEAEQELGRAARHCVLATVGVGPRPSARVVSCYPGPQGQVRFFTNYQSRKAREIESCPDVAAVFYWPPLRLQVRFEGIVSRTTPEVSNAHFARRSVDKQLAALVSPQSQTISSFDTLRLQHHRELARSGAPRPRPDDWGGFELTPDLVEFRVGAHDRHRYEKPIHRKDGAGGWECSELAP